MTRIVEISGRPYAVGLWWQMPSGKGAAGKKAMLREARETAANFENEAYTHAALKAEQYGLAAREGAAWPAKTASLAAALRPLGSLGQQDAFLGVFCLDETKSLWWVCGLLRGLIVADGDAVFNSKEEAALAAAALRLMLGSVGLTEVALDSAEESREYLSPLLGVEPPLADLFKKERPWVLLIGAAAAALILFGVGLSWIYGTYQDIQETRQRTRGLAEKEAQKRDVLANPTRYFNAEWLSAPSAMAAGSQCAAALLALPVSSRAWRFEEAVCRPGESLTVHWAHQKGASFVELPAGASLASPQQATADRALPPLPGRKTQPPPLLGQGQATAALYELTQNLASQLTLSWDAPEQYRLDDVTTMVSPWRRGQFELSNIPAAALLETDLFAALGRHPGTMLASLTRKTNDLTIKGYIYALTN